jgi:hypothetical protein
MTAKPDDLEELRRGLEFRREFDAAFEQEKRAEERAERLAAIEEVRDRWLRGFGYPTRTLIYLVVIILWGVGWYAWLEPKSLWDRPLGSLTVGEIGNNLIWCILTFGGGAMMIRAFFAEDDGGFEYVDWEAWGKFGLGLLVVAILAALWLGSQ